MSVGIQDAFAKLYLKLGGDPEKIKENKNITDYFDSLGNLLEHKVLPDSTPDDNGVLYLQAGGTKTTVWEKRIVNLIENTSNHTITISSDQAKLLRNDLIIAKVSDAESSPTRIDMYRCVRRYKVESGWGYKDIRVFQTIVYEDNYCKIKTFEHDGTYPKTVTIDTAIIFVS